MIVPFEIQADVFNSDAEPKSFLRNLARIVLEFGVLPYSEELRNAVRNSPEWCQVLALTGSKGIDGPNYQIDEGALKSNGTSGVIVLSSSEFDTYKDSFDASSEEERIVLSPNRVELVPLRNTSESLILAARKNWCNETLVPKSFDREEFWSGRIRPVLENSLKWFLVDANFVEKFADSDHDGPKWFIQKIGEMLSEKSQLGKKYRFDIFSSAEDRSEYSHKMAESTFKEIVSLLDLNKIEVNFYVSPRDQFRPVAHDRYLRCSKDGLHRRMNFSDSFDVFNLKSKKSRPFFVFTYTRDEKNKNDIHIKAEDALRNFSSISEFNFSSTVNSV